MFQDSGTDPRLNFMAAQISSEKLTVKRAAYMQAVALLLFLFCVQWATAEAAVREMKGYAKDVETGALIYTEFHRLVEENRKPITHRIEYYTTDGELFAIKTLDYSKDRYAPRFTFADDRFEYSEGGELTREGYQVFNQAKGKERQSEVLEPVSLRVADTGFSPYMREHMALILKGNELKFHLAVPGRLDQFEFGVEVSRYMTSLGRRSVELKVAPKSMLLRALGDPLLLHYDMETRELLVYEGTTNIFNPETGKRYRARVEFPLDENRLIGDAEELDDPEQVLEEVEAPSSGDESPAGSEGEGNESLEEKPQPVPEAKALDSSIEADTGRPESQQGIHSETPEIPAIPPDPAGTTIRGSQWR